ncbi:MAG: exodeoxyribonuclease III [Spirochaetaceae bacterium]|nr:exodeoxyribonuclease III [Spirochaetaceae bacterium]
MLNVYSWNVNGIRAAEKKGFVPWLLGSGADVVCVQEIKARPEQLSAELRNPAGGGVSYRSFWAPAKRPGYSGVAIYSKIDPDQVSVLGNAAFDDEGRVLAARYGNLVVIGAYFPNSRDAGARLPYKLDFCAAILDYCRALVAAGRNIVLCGDYNIAHRPIDLARPRENEGNAGYLPEERAWMDTFTSSGFVDTFRHFHPEPQQYTWWSYRMNARENNVGWRIDYHCVNQGFLSAVRESFILPQVFGSDHCPVGIALGEC